MTPTKCPGAWWLLALSSLVLTACQQENAPAPEPEATAAPPPVQVAEEAADTVTRYSAEAFFATTSVGLPGSASHAFSPDGRHVLMSSDASGVFNVYAQPVDGSDPVQLTNSTTNATFAVSYFPNDERVLFTFDEGGNELNHVLVRETSGETRDLTPGDSLKAAFLGWSDDGEHFYLLSTERDQANFDVYRFSASDYSRELVFENDGFQPSAISGDGRWLALGKPRTSADSNIYLVDLQSADKTPRLITPHDGNVSYGIEGFTASDEGLIFTTNEFGEFAQARVHDISSGEKTPLVQAEWDVSYVNVSPTGRYLVAGVNADARTVVTMTDMTTGQVVTLPDLPEGDLGSVRFTPDEARIALSVNSDVSPSNIFTVDLEGGAVSRLTDTLNPAIDPDDLVASEVVRYESFDGLEIPSILYKPKGASAENPVPALVWVHGGPGGQTRQGYSAVRQHLVNHGYAILGANNRGSSGYGKTFFHLDDKRHGEEDLQDIVYGRKYLETLDWVNKDAIGVIGGSYGGYMVAAALAFEPEVFDVGINIFGVTNWVRTLESIPPWWESFKESLYDEMGDPATDAERHRAISPLFHAENIVRPMLVVQGANDPRVLQVESDELVAAVRENEVPVEYVLFPDEGHGFRRRENRITASEAYVTFLDQYLKAE
jgi:dipeptidyl aminopeptidase/acylaminoacyl peptidase